MAQFKHLTVVFKYIEGDQFRDWFSEQINSRICAVKGNENKMIQVTSWYDGDALLKMEQMEEDK